MPRTRKQTRPSKGRGGSEAKSKAELNRIRHEVANLILDHSPEMAARVIESVIESGQVAALKYLWEACNLFPGEDEESDEQPDSLAKILLERMGIEGDLPGPGPDDDGDVESEGSG